MVSLAKFVVFYIVKYTSQGFPQVVANMGGAPHNFVEGGGLSQNMGGAWGSLKYCRKIPVKEFI